MHRMGENGLEGAMWGVEGRGGKGEGLTMGGEWGLHQ